MTRELDAGLVLRPVTADDAEALTAFVGDVLRAQDDEQPNHRLAAWTRDLVGGRHPVFRPGDATVVVDRRSGAVVSCLHLLSQTWTYGGVPIRVGQPELIGTLPEWRGAGLVRAQFDEIHRLSAERGQQMLVISGIPWFYRQFGYEMAFERGGGPLVSPDPLEPISDPPSGWRVRPAGDADVAFLVELSAIASARSLLSVPRDAALWRYELTGKSPDSAARRDIRILERDGQNVGYLAHLPELWGGNLVVTAFEVAPGVSWREAWTTALPYLFGAGEAMQIAPRPRSTALSFWLLGTRHPLYEVSRFPHFEVGYAWYARVPDVPAFLATVAPALERRLAASACAGHTGTLTLSLYAAGVRLTLDRGKLAGIDSWRPDITVRGLEFGRPSTDPRRPLAMFPDLTFLQLLFGFRTLDELEAAFPDCVVRTQEARALLTALFPRTSSDVWPVS